MLKVKRISAILMLGFLFLTACGSASETGQEQKTEGEAASGEVSTATEEVTDTTNVAETNIKAEEKAEEEAEEKAEEEPVLISQEEVYQLYAAKIEELEKLYGRPVLTPYPYGVPSERWYYLKGLSCLRLTDFNDDGTEELVACYWENADELPVINIYGIKRDEIRELYSAPLGGNGSPVIFEAVFSEMEGTRCFVHMGTQSCDVYAYQNGEMECIEEGKSRAEIDSIDFFSDYYSGLYYSYARGGKSGFVFNYDDKYQAMNGAECIRLYANDVRETLGIPKWDRLAFENPAMEDYYVSEADQQKGVAIPEQLQGYLQRELLPVRPRMTEFTYFRPFEITDYRVEYEGEVYEGKHITPERYEGETGDIAFVFRDLDNDNNAELVVISLEDDGSGTRQSVRMTAEVFSEKGGQVVPTGKAVLSEPALAGHQDSYELFFVETPQGVCICLGEYNGYVDAFSVDFNALRYADGTLKNVIFESFEGQHYGDYFERIVAGAEREGFPNEWIDRWKNSNEDTSNNRYCDGEQGTEMILSIQSAGEFPAGFMGGPLASYLLAEDEEMRQTVMEEHGDLLTKHEKMFRDGKFGVTGFIDIHMAK